MGEPPAAGAATAPPSPRAAGPLRRAAAFALEAAAVAALAWAAVRDVPAGEAVGAAALAALVPWSVADLAATWRLGGSPAQLLFGMRVVRRDGGRPSLGRILVRQAAFELAVGGALVAASALVVLVGAAYERLRPGVPQADAYGLAAWLVLVPGVLGALAQLGAEPDAGASGHGGATIVALAAGGGGGPPPLVWERLLRLALALLMAEASVGVYAAVAPAPIRVGMPSSIDVAPGDTLTLVARGIDPGARVRVRFSGDHGYALESVGRMVGLEQLAVVVPPYADLGSSVPSEHDFAAGTVRLQVFATASARGVVTSNVIDGVHVADLPKPRAPAGLVTFRLLQVIDVVVPDAATRLRGLAPGRHGAGDLAPLAGGLERLATASATYGGALNTLVDPKVRADPATASSRELFGYVDRLVAAGFVALGPHSPSPCAAKDAYVDTLLDVDRDWTATSDAGRQYWNGVTTCAATEVLEVGERAAGWMGVLGLIASGAGIELPLQVVALTAYAALSTATYAILSEAQAVSLGGTKADAENVARGIAQISDTILDPVYEGLARSITETAGPLYQITQSARFIDGELDRVRAGVAPAPSASASPRRSGPTASAPASAPPRAPTSGSVGAPAAPPVGVPATARPVATPPGAPAPPAPTPPAPPAVVPMPQPTAVPPPATPQPTAAAAAALAVTSRSCVLRQRFADGSASYWLDVAGTAAGPEGATVYQTLMGVGIQSKSCGGWGGSGDYGCQRRPGDPPSTQWSMRFTAIPEGMVAGVNATEVSFRLSGTADVTASRYCPSR